MQEFDFRAVRERYACYAQGGIEAYRRERRYVLRVMAQHNLKRARYYQHALAGLRQLGI